MAYNLVGVAGIVADAANAQCSYLPHLIVVHLGDGDVELVSNTRAERADDPTLALQALVLG